MNKVRRWRLFCDNCYKTDIKMHKKFHSRKVRRTGGKFNKGAYKKLYKVNPKWNALP